MSNHTPGPWHIVPDTDKSGSEYLCVQAASGLWIADIVGEATLDTDPLSTANARLIAAAPDLLAMCECELIDYETGYEAFVAYHGGNSSAIDERMRLLRAAIAKARGQQ